MFSRFFIERPIFAAVVSIVIVIAGLVTLGALPIAQYPEIAPPTVTVTASYPGANAQVVAATVAAPIEQEVNGVEGMIYMSSNSTNSGSYSLTVTFETGTDPDMAAVLVQNRVAVAMAKLPEEVKRTGVTTKKRSSNFALMLNLVSPDGRYDDVFLSNYATLQLRDELSRIDGVGDVQVLGAEEYSMRIWLDPEKLDARGLTTNEVAAAIREQNVQVAAGTIGQPPTPQGQAFQYTVSVRGRLDTTREFGEIVIQTGEDGRVTRVKDVARVELGSKSYNTTVKLDKGPSTLIMVYQLPGANLLDLTTKAMAKIKELSQKFPQGMKFVETYNAAWVVDASIDEIIETLIIAAILVILTVFIFLQDWRSTLIPSLTIPVSLVGTFAVMSILGFSINTLTLFGLVLAIGIVVDDAIVVVENTTRNMDTYKLSPREAAIRAMKEVSGPVVATTLVLLAVFVPTAFMGGLTGVLYKQFALTIAVTTVFSSINALTLSPSLCAILLRPTPERRNWFFNGFNRVFDRTTSGYNRVVGMTVRRTLFSGLLFLGISVAAFWGLGKTPVGFVPEEDQGYIMTSIQLPDGASLERTQAVMKRVDEIIGATQGIANNISISGYSLIEGAAGSNMGANFITFKPWGERTDLATQQQTIVAHLQKAFRNIQEAVAVAFVTPALPGLGNAGGFDMMVQDRGAMGLDTLQQVTTAMAQDANRGGTVTGAYTNFRANEPQLFVDVDRQKVKSMDLKLSDVFETMQAFLGQAYVNDFNLFGRTYQVNIQADAAFRSKPEHIKTLKIKNRAGEMVPLGTLVTVKEAFGPRMVTRYNMYPSASLKGTAAPGKSSGQALQYMMDMARDKLPAAMGYQWTGLSYQQTAAGGQAPVILGIAVVFVFLVLAAQYESWKIPVPVILSVPLALLGAVIAIWIRDLDNNTYTQIGLVLLVGLATKNAIMIVEFAKELYEGGKSAVEAAVEAARLRFRPVLMTAFSFILGVIPLVIATGAGAGSRRALGTAVMGGMLAATVLGVLFVPALYVVFQRLGGEKRKRGARGAPAEPPPAPEPPPGATS
jgi:HAE1 family hydrophobic/amphiphilic exporter-1